jgi:MarR family transcriptional regulator, lower aerobic nicotinate degradation pathway regulator
MWRAVLRPPDHVSVLVDGHYMMNTAGLVPRGSRALAELSSRITVQDYWMRPANLLRRAQRLSLALFAEECAHADISRSQFEALIAVSRFPGLDQISLARTFGIDRSTTAQVLDVLVARQLVQRTVHPDDRRKRMLELTPLGAEALADAGAAARRAEARLLQPFTSAEVESLVTALRIMATEVPSSAPDWTLDASLETDEGRRTQFSYLSRRPAFLLRRTVQVAFALFGEATAGLDITPTQYGLLYLLMVVQTDEATISRLIGVERSTSDRLLKRLKTRGYVERGRLRDAPVLQLTPAGEAMFHEVRRRSEAVDNGLIAVLPEAVRSEFIDILAKLLFVHG